MDKSAVVVLDATVETEDYLIVVTFLLCKVP